MNDIKKHVAGVAKFEYYRNGELWYRTESNLLFPVPISDTGDTTFRNVDKAMLFMRWIRKWLEQLKVDISD